MSSPKQVVYRHGLNVPLPQELVDVLNQVYFLHLLANDPEKVIPPGKTLLSMMVHSQMKAGEKDGQAENLLERVQEVAHRAFWKEAEEALSSPVPSVQLSRLQRLYNDLFDALSPLFPRNHKVLQILEAHLPPTSSPLHSALHFLKELLSALRERCAPIRDEAIDSLYGQLDAWRDLHGTPDNESISPLAVLVVETIREIVDLADQMKSDLDTAVIGAMGEHEVRTYVVMEAKARERELVLKLWDAKQAPLGQSLREQWHRWVEMLAPTATGKYGEVSSNKKWVVRLMEQLGTNQAVACSLPSSSTSDNNSTHREHIDPPSNELPPHFLFVVPKLVYIQNYLQAVTIAACLRSLTRLPVTKDTGNNFVDRVWTLLKAEVDDDSNGGTHDLGSIKVINLSDEVVRARRSLSSTEQLDSEDESRLRAAVERTLKPDDPVFLLLHRRLTDALTKYLLQSLSDDHVRSTEGNVPQTMRTGRVVGESGLGKRPKPGPPDHSANASSTNLIRSDGATAPVSVKGFEEPILALAVGGVHEALIGCITWVSAVWGDMIW